MLGLPSTPDPLALPADEAAADRAVAELAPVDADTAALVRAVAGNSPFLAQAMVRQPATLRRAVERGAPAALAEINEAMRRAADETDGAAFMHAGRAHRLELYARRV